MLISRRKSPVEIEKARIIFRVSCVEQPNQNQSAPVVSAAAGHGNLLNLEKIIIREHKQVQIFDEHFSIISVSPGVSSRNRRKKFTRVEIDCANYVKWARSFDHERLNKLKWIRRMRSETNRRFSYWNENKRKKVEFEVKCRLSLNYRSVVGSEKIEQ